MSLENVLAEIEKKREEEIKKLELTNDAELKRISDVTAAKINSLKETAKKNADEFVARLEAREISVAELDAKKIIANAVNTVLEEVWRASVQKIQLMSVEKNQQFLKKLIAKASVFEEGQIYCNERDADFVKLNTRYKFGGVIDCLGGIKVENGDRTVVIDYTYDTIINGLKAKLSKKLANILFEK